METPPKYTTIFFLILTFFSYIHSQALDSCNSPPMLTTPLPFDTSSLHCVAVWESENYILRYTQVTPNMWNFLLSAPNTNAYIAMGFSSDGNMVGSTAVVGWVEADGSTNMKKYYLRGQSPNLVTVQPPDQGLRIGNSSMLFQSNQLYMFFRLMSPSTRLIYSVGPPGRIPVSPTYQLTQHRSMISTALNYDTGTFEAQSPPEENLKESHGLLNMLGWVILLSIGVMVARHARKWDPLWFYSHATIQSLGFMLGVSGVITGLVLENRLGVSVTKHKIIGIVVLVLGSLQVMAILIRPDKESKVRKYWNWYHYTVGGTVIVLAAVNVFYGIQLGDAGSSWTAGFAIALVSLVIISLILEFRTWLSN